MKKDTFLEELNLHLDKNKNPWVADETHTSKLKDKDRKIRHGCLPDNKNHTPQKLHEISQNNFITHIQEIQSDSLYELKTVDWRNRNGNFVTNIKNQSSCGSCVAFSSIATAESLARIIKNIPRSDTIQAIREADIFVFPSFCEVSPLVIFDLRHNFFLTYVLNKQLGYTFIH